jgi:hypothetical protein
VTTPCAASPGIYQPQEGSIEYFSSKQKENNSTMLILASNTRDSILVIDWQKENEQKGLDAKAFQRYSLIAWKGGHYAGKYGKGVANKRDKKTTL